MKMHRAHRPRLSWAGANSVTGLTGLAAAAAILPGHVPGAPADQAPAVSAVTGTVISAPQDFRIAVARQRHYDSAMALYAVKAGDSISAVAVRKCDGQEKDWTGIYAASRKAHLTGRNANVITVGQHLAIDCRFLPGQVHFAPLPPPPPPVRAAVRAFSTVTSSAASVRHIYTPVASGTYSGSGGMERCIISRESGGNSQVMNSSGHYGLYQFSESTWIGSGGSAASFGHASVATQRQVFQNAVAARGYSDWRAYDGC